MMEKATYTAELNMLSSMRELVNRQALANGVNEQDAYNLILALDEAATNIIVHGYQKKGGDIHLEAGVKGDAFVIVVRDHAPHYNPLVAPEPDISIPLSQRPLGGMGVYLIKSIMDEVEYLALPDIGNELTMVKRGIINSNLLEDENGNEG